MLPTLKLHTFGFLLYNLTLINKNLTSSVFGAKCYYINWRDGEESQFEKNIYEPLTQTNWLLFEKKIFWILSHVGVRDL
jgi:hypothetical protein